MTPLLLTSNHRHPARLPSFPQAWCAWTRSWLLWLCSVSVAVSVSVSPLLPSCLGLATDIQMSSGTQAPGHSRQQQGPHCTNPCPAPRLSCSQWAQPGLLGENWQTWTFVMMFVWGESLNKSICVRVELFVRVWRESVLCGWICEGISKAEWGHESYRYIKSFQTSTIVELSAIVVWRWGLFKIYCQALAPNPLDLSPTHFTDSISPKGTGAATKILWCGPPTQTTPLITSKHEGGIPKINSKSRKVPEKSPLLVRQKKIKVDRERKDME